MVVESATFPSPPSRRTEGGGVRSGRVAGGRKTGGVGIEKIGRFTGGGGVFNEVFNGALVTEAIGGIVNGAELMGNLSTVGTGKPGRTTAGWTGSGASVSTICSTIGSTIGCSAIGSGVGGAIGSTVDAAIGAATGAAIGRGVGGVIGSTIGAAIG